MPEYLAPGVYVEETSFRQKTIEGVSTSTAGFIGPTRFGPVAGEPELLTSYFEFERIYGGIDPLRFGDDTLPNDLAHAVRGFFENGGRRLYVSRAYAEPAPPEDAPEPDEDDPPPPPPGVAAHVIAGDDEDLEGHVRVLARHPGVAGNVLVTFGVKVGPNILVTPPDTAPADQRHARLSGAAAFDTVLLLDVAEHEDPEDADEPELFWLEEHLDLDNQRTTFRLRQPGVAATDAALVTDLEDVEVRAVTVTVTVAPFGRFLDERTWEDLAPDPRHRQDPLLEQFAAEPTRRATELYVPLVIDGNGEDAPVGDGVSLVEGLLAEVVDGDDDAESAAGFIRDRLFPPPDEDDRLPAVRPVNARIRLDGGSDGERPGGTAYEGDEDAKSGLRAFEDVEDISIVAAPGSTRDALGDRQVEAAGIQQLLIGHCERMRYRIAVLDAPDAALVGDVRSYRATMDSTHAALYYPWISIVDPLTGRETTTPPSGFIAGVYARNDVERGVHKSPANEVVRLAIGFEQSINKGQQDVLNPEGVNCLRFFEGRGMRVWGARTITSDPEWRYVALRRYFAFLQRSIDKGTQWAVFEPNGHVLWSKVRRTIEDFLFNEWSSGHLMGETIDEAFFVTCDRSTMTQSDFDNGRLICHIGVAPLRPAEFVIFRIGQKTLDSRA